MMWACGGLAATGLAAEPVNVLVALKVPAGCRAVTGTAAAAVLAPVAGWAREVVHETSGMSLVYIPSGSFEMGSPAGEARRKADETQHRVQISRGFYLGKFEVTQAQWQAVTGANPAQFVGPASGTFPVENVRWDDCQEFLRRLNAGGSRFRLPSEAEWEYACRAGTTTPFNSGGALSSELANCNGNLPYGGAEKGEYRRGPLPVGRFLPNAWGLHDMHGNVAEFCQDWYGDYGAAPAVDPQGPGRGSVRIFRGGGWDHDAARCRSAVRFHDSPLYRAPDLGLRVVLDPE